MVKASNTCAKATPPESRTAAQARRTVPTVAAHGTEAQGFARSKSTWHCRHCQTRRFTTVVQRNGFALRMKSFQQHRSWRLGRIMSPVFEVKKEIRLRYNTSA